MGTIKQEIARIQTDRNNLRNWATNVAQLSGVTTTSNLDTVTGKITAIPVSTAPTTSITTSGGTATIPAGYVKSQITVTGPTFTKYYTGSSKPADSSYSNGDIFLVV